jgi:hypothetical protein
VTPDAALSRRSFLARSAAVAAVPAVATLARLRADTAVRAGPGRQRAGLFRRAPSTFVAAGLMPDLDLRPSFHQQVAYKASWHEIGDDAPQYAEMPPG